MTVQQESCNGASSPVSASAAPTVISASKHPIRVHDLDQEALKVLYRLRDAGFRGYLVGGGVRDLYMGKRPKDFDISTNARPGQLRKLFRNSRTIGRRFRLVQVFFRGGKIIEVSTLRSQEEFDINGSDKVLASNNTYGTEIEDAFRRDLTINSLFYEVESNTIIDYVGGVEDLDRGLIRIVGEPERRVTRDPVRIMRAVRHAARNGFRIEEETWRAIVKNRDKLELCPTSRIRDELFKDLSGGKSEPWARIALQCQMFYTLFPFYRDIMPPGVEDNASHELFDLLRVVDRLLDPENDYQVELPDYFILAVFLVPWASARFDLLRRNLKEMPHHMLSRAIRSGLDEILSERLCVKRIAKEAITLLLVNLPTFRLYHARKDWPKWLRSKSYFDDCFRFYNLLLEAKGEGQVDSALFSAKSSGLSSEYSPLLRSGSGSSSKGGRNRDLRPAFASGRKGVFGLRRK